MFAPVLDQAWGDRLGTDVHQAPLGERVIVQVDPACVNGNENVVGPGDQQPGNGALLFGNGLKYPFGLDTVEQNAFFPLPGTTPSSAF